MKNRDIKLLFSEQSELYERFRPVYPKELINTILQFLQQRERVWDCATGSGQLARLLVEEFDEVIATDISKEQIQNAPSHPRIEYRVATAENSGLPDNYVDLITVGQAFHWFDKEGFYRETERVSRRGGVLALTGYGRLELEGSLNEPVYNFYDQMFRDDDKGIRRQVESKYEMENIPFEEVENTVISSKFQWTREDLLGYLHSWSAVQRFKRELGVDPVEELLPVIELHWPEEECVTAKFHFFLRVFRL